MDLPLYIRCLQVWNRSSRNKIKDSLKNSILRQLRKRLEIGYNVIKPKQNSEEYKPTQKSKQQMITVISASETKRDTNKTTTTTTKNNIFFYLSLLILWFLNMDIRNLVKTRIGLRLFYVFDFLLYFFLAIFILRIINNHIEKTQKNINI